MDSTFNASEKSQDFQKLAISIVHLLVDIREDLKKVLSKMDTSNPDLSDDDMVTLAITLAWRHGPNHTKIAEMMTKQTGQKVHRTGLMKNKLYKPYRDVYRRLTSQQGEIPRDHHEDFELEDGEE